MENSLQQYFQVFHDPIADVLDHICSKSLSTLANYELEKSANINFIRQPVSLSFSAGVSLQSSSKDLQSYQESNEEYFCFVFDHQEKLFIHEFRILFSTCCSHLGRKAQMLGKF